MKQKWKTSTQVAVELGLDITAQQVRKHAREGNVPGAEKLFSGVWQFPLNTADIIRPLLKKRGRQPGYSPKEKIKYKGDTGTITYFSAKYEIKRSTLNMRIEAGWPIDKAIETPVLER